MRNIFLLGHDGSRQGRVSIRNELISRDALDNLSDDELGVDGILLHGFHNHTNINVVVFIRPRVVVSDEANDAVSEFGFTGQLGFSGGGHTNEVGIHATVGVGFGLSGEGGTFHGDEGGRFVDLDIGELAGGGGVSDDLVEGGASGATEGSVGDDAVAEEGGGAGVGLVDELSDDGKGARGEFLAERTDGGDGNEVLDTERLEGPDVGTIVDFSGSDGVLAAVAGDEGDANTVQGGEDDAARREPEGSNNGDFFLVFKTVHLVETRSTNDTDKSSFLRHDDDDFISFFLF